MARIFITIIAALVAAQLAKSQQVDNPTLKGSDIQEVTLIGGSLPGEGNVYAVNSEKQFGPIFANNWEYEDARVVCRQLGYTDGFATKGSMFGDIRGDFSMFDVNCTGDEDRIQDCPHSTNITNLQQNSKGGGAGVWCDTNISVIIRGGSTPSEGNVYAVNTKKQLGPVCAIDWGNANAKVVCRQLGYAHGVTAIWSHFGYDVTGTFSMENVNCTGYEARIQECPYTSLGQCDGGVVVGVRCSNVSLGEKCECNGAIGTDIDGGTIGQCRYRWGRYFCFIEEDSECVDKATTEAFKNPRNEEAMKFYSNMACYPLQVIDGEAKCPEDSTICGDSCIPPVQVSVYDWHVYCCVGNNNSQAMRMDQACNSKCQGKRTICGDSCISPGQQAENDKDVYCCTSDNTSQAMRMNQICGGKSCGVDSDGRRRSLCGITNPTCIYSIMEDRDGVNGDDGKDYCCNDKVINWLEECDGCDYTSLPCNQNNSTQCLHRYKWCDGTRDCPDGEDEVETSCHSNDLFQRSCGRVEPGRIQLLGSELTRCSERVGQCFISSPPVAGHRCIDRMDQVANNSLVISTPSLPLLNFCRTDINIHRAGDLLVPGIICSDECVPYSLWCRDNNAYSDPCIVDNSTFMVNDVTVCTGEGPGQLRFGDNENKMTDRRYYNDYKTFCEIVTEKKLNYLFCDNKSRCYHASLKCDGKAQCRDKSDEEDCRCPVTTRPDHQRLPQTQTDFFLHNYNRPQATFACRNMNDTDICAIRCNGVFECQNSLDETGCQLSTYYLVYILIALFVITITLAEFGKFFQPEMPNTSPLRTLQITENLLALLKLQHPTFQQKKEMSRFMKVHHRRHDFSQRLELIHAVISLNPDRELAKRATKALYEGIFLMHDKDKTRTFMCLRKNVRNAEFIEAIQDAADPGFFRTLVPRGLKNWYHQFSVRHPMTLYITFAITSVAKMIFYFLDFGKDITAVYIIIAVAFAVYGQEVDQETTWKTASANLTDYHVQLLLVLALSVLVPLLINAFVSSRNHPGAALGMLVLDRSKMSKPTHGVLVAFSFLFCITTQVVVLWRLMRTKLEITSLKVELQSQSSRTNIDRILHLRKEEEIWENILLQHKKTDVSVEISVQSIVEILMLLLLNGSSRSKQVFGLEELFKAEDWLFYLALLNTIKKIVMTNLDIIQSRKGFLGSKGKMILIVNYLLSGCIRVTAIVAFFSGPLGLFDILIGFQPDPPFVKALSNTYIPIDPRDLESIYHLSIANVIFFPLKYYYIAFMILVVVHCILVFVLKQFYTPSFKSRKMWSEKFLNVIHNFAFIEELEDFDEDPTAVTMAELKKNYDDIGHERSRLTLVFLTENFLLSLPLAYTCREMLNFYEELSTKTSLFPEEMAAYSTCRTLMWLPVTISLMTILTIPLPVAFYKFGHPWKVLVNSFEELDNENIDFCELLNNEKFPANMTAPDIEQGEHIEMDTLSAIRIAGEDMEDVPEEQSLDDGKTDSCENLVREDFTGQMPTVFSVTKQSEHTEATEMMVKIKGDNLKRTLKMHKKRNEMLRRNFFSTISEVKAHDAKAGQDFFLRNTGSNPHVTKLSLKAKIAESKTEKEDIEEAQEEQYLDKKTDFCKQSNKERSTGHIMTLASVTEEGQHTADIEMFNKIRENSQEEQPLDNSTNLCKQCDGECSTANMRTLVRVTEQGQHTGDIIKQLNSEDMRTLASVTEQADNTWDIEMTKLSSTMTEEDNVEDTFDRQVLQDDQTDRMDFPVDMTTLESVTEEGEHTNSAEMTTISEEEEEEETAVEEQLLV